MNLLFQLFHKMNDARIGRDPKTSLLNVYNQFRAVKNIFTTDGPTIHKGIRRHTNSTPSFIAMTAQAVNFAINGMNEKNL